MSAFGGKADMPFCVANVRFGSKADIGCRFCCDAKPSLAADVRCTYPSLWQRHFDCDRSAHLFSVKKNERPHAGRAFIKREQRFGFALSTGHIRKISK